MQVSLSDCEAKRERKSSGALPAVVGWLVWWRARQPSTFQLNPFFLPFSPTQVAGGKLVLEKGGFSRYRSDGIPLCVLDSEGEGGGCDGGPGFVREVGKKW